MKIYHIVDLAIELMKSGKKNTGLDNLIQYGLSKGKEVVVFANIEGEIYCYTYSSRLAKVIGRKFERKEFPVKSLEFKRNSKKIYTLSVFGKDDEVEKALPCLGLGLSPVN